MVKFNLKPLKRSNLTIPSKFDYHAPETVNDAVALLDKYGEDAKILAGGHSLLPIMKLRFAEPAHLIDINKIAELSGVRERMTRLSLEQRR